MAAPDAMQNFENEDACIPRIAADGLHIVRVVRIIEGIQPRAWRPAPLNAKYKVEIDDVVIHKRRARNARLCDDSA